MLLCLIYAAYWNQIQAIVNTDIVWEKELSKWYLI